MNDSNGDSVQKAVSFYPGKKQLMPVAINIAIAPIMLYILRIWPWPPTVVHLAVFVLTSIMALRYFKYQLQKVRMVIDDSGIHCGQSYPAESILAVKPYMRALKIWINVDGKEREKVLNLWWAGKEDIQSICQLASERFSLRE